MDPGKVRAFQRLGPAFARMAKATKSSFFFRVDCVLYARSIEEPVLTNRSVKDLVFREAQVRDLALFEAILRPPDVQRYRTLFEAGRHCVMALKSEKLIAYGWFTSHVDPVKDRVHVPLAEDEILIFDLFTTPAYRRRGIQTILVQKIFGLATKRGYTNALSLVLVDNLPSLNLHDKLGFRAISHFTKVRALGLVCFFYRPNLFGKAGAVVRWLP